MHNPCGFIQRKIGIRQMFFHILADHLISGIIYRIFLGHTLFHQTEGFQSEGLQVAFQACKAFRFQQFYLFNKIALLFLSEQSKNHVIQLMNSRKISLLMKKPCLKII